MSLSDSYKKHGAKAVIYNPRNVFDIVSAVLTMLEQRGERRVIAVAVAAMLVKMHADLAGDGLDNTIELMRAFIANAEPPPRSAGN